MEKSVKVAKNRKFGTIKKKDDGNVVIKIPYIYDNDVYTPLINNYVDRVYRKMGYCTSLKFKVDRGSVKRIKTTYVIDNYKHIPNKL